MPDYIARLDAIDKRRAALHAYKTRIKLARWILPQTAKSFIAKLDDRFQRLTTDRRQVMELIKADPVLRKRLYEREQAALKQSPQKERDRG